MNLNNEAKRKELILRYLNAETTIEEERLLIDYYMHTEDELTPEEEDVRLLLTATRPYPHYKKLSEQKETEFDQLMQPFRHQDKKSRNYRQWFYPAIGAIAASFLFLLTLHHHQTVKIEKIEKNVVAQQSTMEQIPQPLPSLDGEKNPPNEMRPKTTEKQLKPQDKKTHAQHHVATVRESPIPDTLGNGIWKREENVLTALHMLADCEATIEREEQEVRNDIIQATFRATPQPTGVRLVSNEAGDYEVIDPKTIIDI